MVSASAVWGVAYTRKTTKFRPLVASKWGRYVSLQAAAHQCVGQVLLRGYGLQLARFRAGDVESSKRAVLLGQELFGQGSGKGRGVLTRNFQLSEPSGDDARADTRPAKPWPTVASI